MVSDTPVLVSKSEVSWLRGELKLAISYEKRLRFNIKHKVKALAKVELPLLADKGFFFNDIDVSANCNGVTILTPFLKKGKPWMGFGPYFYFYGLKNYRSQSSSISTSLEEKVSQVCCLISFSTTFLGNN
jgi:hypothetical protein